MPFGRKNPSGGGRHRNTDDRRRCGHSWTTAAIRMPNGSLHSQHTCGLMIDKGQSRHPGSHQCNNWDCGETQ